MKYYIICKVKKNKYALMYYLKLEAIKGIYLISDVGSLDELTLCMFVCNSGSLCPSSALHICQQKAFPTGGLGTAGIVGSPSDTA